MLLVDLKLRFICLWAVSSLLGLCEGQLVFTGLGIFQVILGFWIFMGVIWEFLRFLESVIVWIAFFEDCVFGGFNLKLNLREMG